jgi:carbonic anhydrase
LSSQGVDPREALARLREGNRRFASNVRSLDALHSGARRGEMIDQQRPFAIVLGCSDARAPAEAVFDQGLGELFVIRIAGNIVAPSGIGSIEFAAERFGIRLVVVLGHSHCGAIAAALEAVRTPARPRSRNLLSIVDRVRPAVEDVVRLHAPTDDMPALSRACVRANVRASVSHLRHGSPMLEELILGEGLAIVGAEYDLETGVVDFFDNLPAE